MNFSFDEQALLKQSAIWNMPSFLETYTFHDSSLYEFRVRSSDDLLVFIGWDLHWNKAIPSEYNLVKTPQAGKRFHSIFDKLLSYLSLSKFTVPENKS